MKLFMKLVSLCLTLVIFASNVGISEALAHGQANLPGELLYLERESDLRELQNSMKNMTEHDLQKIIELSEIGSEVKGIVDILVLKAAWLAAAQIARNKGYPLAATLVEHSVWYMNYFEVNGQFASKIKTTVVYVRMIQKGRGTDAFSKSVNRDLFYSINKFSYNSSASSQGMRLRLYDTYDFALDMAYDNLFTSLVNNWAFLNQNMWVLHPIQVTIYIDV